MNYRPLVEEKIREFKEAIPSYTFAQTILAALKQLKNFESFKKSDLLDMSDEDFYTILEAAVRKERIKLDKYKD